MQERRLRFFVFRRCAAGVGVVVVCGGGEVLLGSFFVSPARMLRQLVASVGLWLPHHNKARVEHTQQQ